jgi:hypothetical protein
MFEFELELMLMLELELGSVLFYSHPNKSPLDCLDLDRIELVLELSWFQVTF